MNDNDIIKALEYCLVSGDCAACMYNESHCIALTQDALDLINRLEAENEKLKEAYLVYEETSGLKQAKTEAIKKFAEKFEEALGDVFMVNHPCVSAIIDNLVEEMTEGQHD